MNLYDGPVSRPFGAVRNDDDSQMLASRKPTRVDFSARQNPGQILKVTGDDRSTIGGSDAVPVVYVSNSL